MKMMSIDPQLLNTNHIRITVFGELLFSLIFTATEYKNVITLLYNHSKALTAATV